MDTNSMITSKTSKFMSILRELFSLNSQYESDVKINDYIELSTSEIDEHASSADQGFSEGNYSTFLEHLRILTKYLNNHNAKNASYLMCSHLTFTLELILQNHERKQLWESVLKYLINVSAQNNVFNILPHPLIGSFWHQTIIISKENPSLSFLCSLFLYNSAKDIVQLFENNFETLLNMNITPSWSILIWISVLFES